MPDTPVLKTGYVLSSPLFTLLASVLSEYILSIACLLRPKASYTAPWFDMLYSTCPHGGYSPFTYKRLTTLGGSAWNVMTYITVRIVTHQP